MEARIAFVATAPVQPDAARAGRMAVVRHTLAPRGRMRGRARQVGRRHAFRRRRVTELRGEHQERTPVVVGEMRRVDPRAVRADEFDAR
ncbi:hypothetical protein KPA97_66045, partial [Burkholderia cenocepacia]|nr:hypothetical protein [Burkholderia cenocepacia]MDR5670872.1 hypothetical protein [Burkholderia cenocepacia]